MSTLNAADKRLQGLLIICLPYSAKIGSPTRSVFNEAATFNTSDPRWDGIFEEAIENRYHLRQPLRVLAGEVVLLADVIGQVEE